MTEIYDATPKEAEPEIFLEVKGHLRYICVREGELVEKERIPLHIWNLDDESTAKLWFMKEHISKLKRKMFKRKGGMLQVKGK